MTVTPGFLNFVVEQLEGCGALTTRRMFGAIGIYADDVFFAIVDNDILYLKADETTRPDFIRQGCEPFRPYGDDRESMNYYTVPVAVLEDADALCRWGRKAVDVARAARAGKKRPRIRPRKKNP